MADAPTTDRKKRGSLMMDYFLIMLFVFGSVQLYFNGMQDTGMNHQLHHIADFQRRHFVKSRSKSLKHKVEENVEESGDASFHHRNVEDENEQEGNEETESKDDSVRGQFKNHLNDSGGRKEEGNLEHRLAGLNCDQFGGPSRDDAAEMIFWEDIPPDSLHVSPFHRRDQKQYLTFEADHGGWNNIRMAMETTMAMAVAMGRTLVLPPAQSMYLLTKDTHEHSGKQQRKEFSFADFFHMETISKEFVGLDVITMKEFLEREGLKGNLKDQTTGEVLFPPHNRTEYDGADHHTISSSLETYLHRVGMVPPWDPDECIAAFPATSNPKDVQELRDMMRNSGTFPKFEAFIDKPVPINASAIDRLKEMRADRTKICLYDEKWQNMQLIHFGEGGKGEAGSRLLVHFYAFLFFQDWKHDLWMKRFIRDHVRYIDEIQCAAARIVKALRERSRTRGDSDGNYNAYHIRRGDFQYTVTRYDAPRIIKNSAEIQTGSVVYIASDETDPQFFEPFRKAFDVVMLSDFKQELVGVNSNYYGMIDSLIASRAKIFFGCWFSTFTGYINRIRGFHHNKKKGRGYEMGYHESYYYALDDRKFHLQAYYPVKKSFYAREFPTAWRLIDNGIYDLSNA